MVTRWHLRGSLRHSVHPVMAEPCLQWHLSSSPNTWGRQNQEAQVDGGGGALGGFT